MDNIVISIISIALFGIAAVLSLLINHKKEHDTNYYSMFVIGCIFLTLGLTLDIQGFTIIGFILALTGFLNKSKWIVEKGKKKLTRRERVLKIAIITTTIAALVFGTIIFLLSR